MGWGGVGVWGRGGGKLFELRSFVTSCPGNRRRARPDVGRRSSESLSLEFIGRGGLIEIHSATLKPPPPSHVRSMHFILHLSTWHSKPALPPKLLLLLNYNFVRSGSVQYRRQSEISLEDRAVSPPASITCTAAPDRQLISWGFSSQRLPSKHLEPDRKFLPTQ